MLLLFFSLKMKRETLLYISDEILFPIQTLKITFDNISTTL